MAHAVDAHQFGTGDAPGGVLPAGKGHQRVSLAVQHQGGAVDAAQLLGALACVRANRHHLPQGAGRVVAALKAKRNMRAQCHFVYRETRAADHAVEVDEMRDDGLHVGTSGAGEQGFEHPGLGFGQTACAAGTHDAGQAEHLVGRGQGDALGDHAAHGDADDVGFRDVQGVEHADGVSRHVFQRVGWRDRQTQLELERGPDDVLGAQVLKVLGQTDVAIVMPHHTVAVCHQGVDQRGGPSHQLHAKAHDEHDHRAPRLRAISTGVFNFDFNPVCFYFHSNISLFKAGVRQIGCKFSFEFTLTQPFGRDPLLTGNHRRTAVQRFGGGVGFVIAEKDGVAALGANRQVHFGEGGATAFFRVV